MKERERRDERERAHTHTGRHAHTVIMHGLETMYQQEMLHIHSTRNVITGRQVSMGTTWNTEKRGEWMVGWLHGSPLPHEPNMRDHIKIRKVTTTC